MAKISKCAANLVAAFKDQNLTAEEAEKVITDLQRKINANRVRATTEPGLMDRLAMEQAIEYREAAKLAKYRAKVSAMKLVDASVKVRAFDQPAQGAQAVLSGHQGFQVVKQDVKGGLDSVASRQNTIIKKMYDDYRVGMEGVEPGANRRFHRDKVLQENVARELAALTDGKPATKSVEAQGIAKVISNIRARLVALLNQEGAGIRKLPSYIMMQTHDFRKMVKKGKEAWKKVIIDRIDKERTFSGQDPEKVLDDIWDKIQRNENGAYQVTPEGRGSLANRLSQERYLHFKTADDWIEYHNEFGNGSIADGYLLQMEELSRAAGMMQITGPNPPRFIKNLIDQEQTAAKSLGKEPMSKGDVAAIEDVLADLLGETNAVVIQGVGSFGKGLRLLQTMAKLGNGWLSALPDVVGEINNARYNGKSWLQAYWEPMETIFGSMPKEVKKQFSSYLGVMVDGQLGSMYGRVSADNLRPGFAAKAANAYFWANGLTPWTNMIKRGAMWGQAKLLADVRGMKWNDLDGFFQRQMNRYGIDEGEWGKFAAMEPGGEGGRQFLTPRDIDDAELSGKILNWMTNEAEFAAPTPGVRERAFFIRGTKAGTAPGEIMRFIAQFKMFSMGIMMRSIPRAIELGVPGVVNMVVIGGGLGYASLVAKDWASGKEARDPTDFKTVMAALSTSGGGGFAFDMLSQEFTGFGTSVADYIGGPATSAATDVFEIYTRAKQGKEPGAAAFRALVRNTPGANLYFSRAALNYLILYQVQESMNPGYLRRMERRLKREKNQEYFFRPSQFVR